MSSWSLSMSALPCLPPLLEFTKTTIGASGMACPSSSTMLDLSYVPTAVATGTFCVTASFIAFRMYSGIVIRCLRLSRSILAPATSPHARTESVIDDLAAIPLTPVDVTDPSALRSSAGAAASIRSVLDFLTSESLWEFFF